MSDKKIQVCRSLTSVVRSLGESSTLDPKAFFLMLSSNYDALQTGEALDGIRLYEAMQGTVAEPQLDWLFVGFDKAARRKEFTFILPPHLDQLSLPEREAMASSPPTGATFFSEITDSGLDAEADILRLSTDDLRPVVTEERKKEIVQLIAKCIHEAPVGEYLDKGQFIYQLDQNIDTLLDGEHLTLQPIVDGLRQLDRVVDSDIYVGIARLQEALLFQGISMGSVDLDVPEEQKQVLVERFEEIQKKRLEESIPSTTSSTDLKKPPPAATPTAEKKVSNREEELKSLGLGKQKRLPAVVRYGVLGMLLLAAGVTAFLLRPTRDLNVKQFRPFPMAKAALREGVFVGVVDEKTWTKLTVDQREQTLDQLQVKLRDEGWLIDAQVRDEKGVLVVVNQGPTLRGSRSFLGTLLKAAPGEIAPTPPSDAPEPEPEPPAAPAEPGL